MRIPEGVTWLDGTEDGAAWLAALPATVAAVAERWELAVGEPFEGSSASWVAPAQRGSRSGGGSVVLKVQWPDAESEHEAAALLAWLLGS